MWRLTTSTAQNDSATETLVPLRHCFFPVILVDGAGSEMATATALATVSNGAALSRKASLTPSAAELATVSSLTSISLQLTWFCSNAKVRQHNSRAQPRTPPESHLNFV